MEDASQPKEDSNSCCGQDNKKEGCCSKGQDSCGGGGCSGGNNFYRRYAFFIRPILTVVVLSLVFFGAVSAVKKLSRGTHHALVIMTDFGTADGAVSAMRGVAFGVDETLPIFDLTHEIPEYDIWQGAYRLQQVVEFWPEGTVFVSVVDPGVGTERVSVVAKSKSGHYFVNPNNGLLTLIHEKIGIEEMRHIDEKKNRLANSYDSYTFHGRDVYVYTGARLASSQITFKEVGDSLPVEKIILLAYTAPVREANTLRGIIPVLDPNYGNVWTNIPVGLFEELEPQVGEFFTVRFFHDGRLVAQVEAPYHNTFGGVRQGAPLLYLNSLMEVSLALNMANFARTYGVSSGLDWQVEIQKH